MTTINYGVDEIITITRAALLRDGGVDDWEWYGDSIDAYVPSDNEYEDAESFLNALYAGGVDDWEWYSESLEGLDEYEDYLTNLSDISLALSFDAWDATRKAVIVNTAPAAINVGETNQLAIPRCSSEESLFAYLAENYKDSDTAELFDKLVTENKFWAQKNFPKEFAKAIKEIKEGITNPLEVARSTMLALIIKNGKLDEFIRNILG